MQLRQNVAPNLDRDEAIRQLTDIRTLLQHRWDITIRNRTTCDVIFILVKTEAGSLGSSEARRQRKRTDPETINDILTRAAAEDADHG